MSEEVEDAGRRGQSPGAPGLEPQPRLSAARPRCSNRPRFSYLEVDCTAWDRKKVQVQIRFLRPTQRALWAQAERARRLLRGRGGGQSCYLIQSEIFNFKSVQLSKRGPKGATSASVVWSTQYAEATTSLRRGASGVRTTSPPCSPDLWGFLARA